MRHAVAVALLFAFWVLLSGYFTAFLLTMGALSAVGVAALAWRMTVIDHEGHPYQLGPAALAYWPWLFKEIVKSAWDVSKIILHPRLPISPCWVRVKASQKTVVGRVTFANSITLTPGTITVDAESDTFLVHALTKEGAAGLEEGEMDRRVAAFEGKP